MESKKIINDLITPIGAFLRLGEFNPVFLLESVEKSGAGGRYSFIGLDPMHSFAYRPDAAPAGQNDGSFAEQARAVLSAVAPLPESAGRLPAGLVGITDFELFAEFEGLPWPENRNREAAAEFIVPRIIIAFDHFEHNYSVTQLDAEDANPSLTFRILDALHQALPPPKSGAGFGEAEAAMSRDRFLEAVETTRRRLCDGEAYQVVLSLRFEGETDLEPFQIYRAMRYLNPSPYLYFLNLNGRCILGSSPESMVRLDGDEISLRPASGRREIDKEGDEAEQTGDRLAADESERARHMVLADLANNDCCRASEAGSVRAVRVADTDRHGREINLISTFTGRVRADADALDIFQAVFPSGSAVGAPKRGAYEIIREIEDGPRGPCGGAVGYFSANGTMDHAIATRTIVIREGRYTAYSGVGIDPESDPLELTERAFARGRSLLQALELARDGL